MRQLYACLDADKTSAPFQINPEDAEKLNAKGYAIYWAVNEFNGPRRITELKQIKSWYVEIDGDKETQIKRINASPLVPSLVVESKNGFHIYFNVKGSTTLEDWPSIQAGLLHYFGGDPKAKDVTRLLRVPGYNHLKNPSEPFLVKEVFRSDCAYTTKAMQYYFKAPMRVEEGASHVKENPPPATITSTRGDEAGLNEKLSSINNMTALQILSGKACVNGEVYSFKPTSRGRFNIFVNGKGTSCFIDEAKRIGATPGGPTVWQWLKYYGHSNSEIARILKDELGI